MCSEVLKRFDSHIHGAFGVDVSDADVDGIVLMSRELYKRGIDAFCPTTMTIPAEQIWKVCEAVARAKEILEQSDDKHATIAGIHLEGPFLSPEYAKVQSSSCIISPRDGIKLVDELASKYGDLIKIVGVAPEMEGGLEFVSEISQMGICVSLAHTGASYELSRKAFDQGARSVTHVLNAMRPFDKREPGVLGAAIDDPRVYVEVICDGHHIHRTMLKTIFSMINSDRLVVISDSMRGAFMPDGDYMLGDVLVSCKNGRTYFGEGGNLAGSISCLPEEQKVLQGIQIPSEIISKAMWDNPWARIGILQN